jgi:hypothetical protein
MRLVEGLITPVGRLFLDAEYPHPRHSQPILIRTDSAESSTRFLTHIRGLRGHRLDIRLPVDIAVTEPIRAVLARIVDEPDR